MEFNPGMNIPLNQPPAQEEVSKEKSWEELMDELHKGNDNAELYNISPRLSKKKKFIPGGVGPVTKVIKKRKAA